MLPPSEGKSRPSRGKPLDLETLSFPVLTPARQQVIESLQQVCSGPDAARVLGLGPTQASQIALNLELHDSPTARADQIYTGVLYDCLDVDSLDSAAKARLTRRVVITSSVFGWVRPSDRIASYRLAGGVSLPGLGPVAAHWRSALPHAAQEMGDQLVVDLRSTTYANFWKFPHGHNLASVRVLHEANGVRKIVSHFNKATKGRITRDLVSSPASPGNPANLVDLLNDLGWHSSLTRTGASGSQIDVVVSEL
ncbi:MAG: peroxide stress protein YaaA [Marmoricola sp.]